MLGPFATMSRLTPCIQQMSLAILSRAACDTNDDDDDNDNA